MASAAYEQIVERNAVLPNAVVRVVRYNWVDPVDEHWAFDDHGLLDVSLSPRPSNARACYEGRWRRDRFEPLGDIAFFPPGTQVHTRADIGHLRTLQCLLPRDALPDSLGRTDSQLPETLNLRVPAIHQSCMRILTELYAPAYGTPSVIEALCHLLAVDLVRHFSALSEPRLERGGLAPWRMKRIEERASQDGPAPTIDELAALCGLGRRQLMRSFKQSQHENIHTYIAKVRLDRAKQHLAGNETITKIAFRLGFSSSSGFSSFFRRMTGTVPRHYRGGSGPRWDEHH